MADVTPSTAAGLTAAEVAERVAAGRSNRRPPDPGRTIGQILRANVLTPVNGIVGVLFVAIVVARGGLTPDCLFVGVIVANSVIGTVQELRARAALDRLAVLEAPRAVVVRDGATTEVDVEDVVVDDLVVLGPGAQVVVDGDVVRSDGLELDESLLTGEADPVHKEPGDLVRSGSFVAAGSGAFRATHVGAESYAASLATEARRFTLVGSELRRGVNRILRFLMVALPPVAAVLLWRLLVTGDSWQEAVTGVVAASVAMVPDGLVLLTSVAFAAAVVKLARRDALLRELASVELLARVDVLCLDKTGTITTGEIQAVGVEPLGDGAAFGVEDGLAAMAASDPEPNATLAAIGRAHPAAPDWVVVDTVPFSSARKWSGVQFRDRGALVLGAPEVLVPADHALQDRVREQAAAGRRVVLLAAAPALAGERCPEGLRPLALVLLEDRVREDAPEILGWFAGQGVSLRVISGDHPATVAAVAARAGVVGAADGGTDARELPEEPAALARELDGHVVFGRVTPHQKQAMVEALQSSGHTVAMTGDGVNDVLALKDADMGIAMGSGSAASRAVAQLVLLGDRFDVLPGVLAEGRRVINSVERAANLFIYGTVYSACMAVVIAVAGADYPFLPRHLTLVRTLSVGVPGLVLALAPDPRRARTGFVGRVVRFAVPAGCVAAVASLAVYFAARALDTTLVESRSGATVTLLAVGLVILLRLTRTLPPWRWALVGAMAGAVVLVLVVPPLAELFQLELPPGPVWAAMVVAVAAAAVAVHVVPVASDAVDGAGAGAVDAAGPAVDRGAAG